MNSFQTVVALFCVVGASMFLVAFATKRRDWVQVFLSATGYLALAVGGGIFGTYASWGPDVWPAGPMLWVALAVLVLSLKALWSRMPPTEGGRLLPISFLAWTMLTIGATTMMLVVRHGVTATYDEVVMYGILTLGLAQLGFAGIFEKNLIGSGVGRAAWTIALIVGSITFIFTLIVAFILATTRIVF